MTGSNTSILLFFFGQSNADVFPSKPPLDHPLEQDPRILTPNDGWGVRGCLGRAQRQPISGFDPAFGKTDKGQSMGIAAAARILHDLPDADAPRVIVRSGAKGSMRLDGFTHRGRDHFGLITDHLGEASPILTSYLEVGRQIVQAARDAQHPVGHVYIPFFHGESDMRLPRTTYATRLSHLIGVVDSTFAEMGLETTWLLTQPGGTSSEGNGNHWPNRLALWDVADRHDNAYLVAANYAYPMQDHSHIGATGKALIGEKLGIVISRLMAGAPPDLPRPIDWRHSEGFLEVRFAPGTELILDRAQFPAPNAPDGFSTSPEPALQVAQAELSRDGVLRLRLSEPRPARPFCLNYAYRDLHKRNQTPSDGYPFGRGCLRAAAGTRSILLPEYEIYDWVPAFSLPFD